MLALIITALTGLFVLYLGFSNRPRLLQLTAIAGLLMAICASLFGRATGTEWLEGMLVMDRFSVVFNISMTFFLLIILLFIVHYFRNETGHLPEIVALMIFSLFGAMLMTSFENMMVLFIGVETMSIPLYVIAGSNKFSIRSNEASFKYFLLGSFATAIFLLGVVFMYGATGSFQLQIIAEYVSSNINSLPPYFYLGVILIFAGFLFKVAAVPFHFWTPDVYEGSPAPVTIFMATVVKTAGIAAFYRLFSSCFAGLPDSWHNLLWVCTVLTLLLGNLAAARQEGVKRMLAYSSISHTGFLLLGLVSVSIFSPTSVFFYALAYSLATIPAFIITNLIKNNRNNDRSINGFRGLAGSNKLLTGVMLISMMSLAGIPLTAGFFAKYAMFVTALENDFVWLVIIALAAALIGVYYYFRIIIVMFSDGPEISDIKTDMPTLIALILCSFLSLGLGIFPLFDHWFY